jgi:hypothetical protein
MAYKQNPGRGNQPKTGHGVPAPFKQTMGAVGAGAGTATGKYITEKAKKIGNKIYKGAEYLSEVAEGRHGSANYSESDESMRQKNLPSVKNPKTNEKKKSPMKQMETIKKIGNKIYEGVKYVSDLAEGRHGSANYSGGDESMRIKNIVRNKKTEEVKKEVKKPAPKKPAPTKQLGRQAVTKMGGKKTPAKMKSC